MLSYYDAATPKHSKCANILMPVTGESCSEELDLSLVAEGWALRKGIEFMTNNDLRLGNSYS